MRQGQQNRRGRSRGGSGASGGNGTNNNRKGQNPLSRTYESNGPDVKIRGTASQIAEKYSTLARDASSSSDTVMAENYLQHAEHYNRIIMAAQAQYAQPGDQNDGEAAQAVNGVHRGARDGHHAMREQAQHEATNIASPLDRPPQAAAASEQPPSVEQPSVDERPVTEQSASTSAEAKKDAAPDDANGEAEQGRRRRRRYPGGNGAGRSAAAEGEGGKAADAVGDDRSSDEVTA